MGPRAGDSRNRKAALLEECAQLEEKLSAVEEGLDSYKGATVALLPHSDAGVSAPGGGNAARQSGRPLRGFSAGNAALAATSGVGGGNGAGLANFLAVEISRLGAALSSGHQAADDSFRERARLEASITALRSVLDKLIHQADVAKAHAEKEAESIEAEARCLRSLAIDTKRRSAEVNKRIGGNRQKHTERLEPLVEQVETLRSRHDSLLVLLNRLTEQSEQNAAKSSQRSWVLATKLKTGPARLRRATRMLWISQFAPTILCLLVSMWWALSDARLTGASTSGSVAALGAGGGNLR
eukprot:TRINITY_DN45531_c0_g1_i1.p1 TRINITY_DN45531_c0_g1~~TRINITY_DN45531_c0_g1_i1.p1  ORF type:complete len:297 (+),score=64.67 TRINITY_DN45531_c0_g1_i1:130-1020(+)